MAILYSPMEAALCFDVSKFIATINYKLQKHVCNVHVHYFGLNAHPLFPLFYNLTWNQVDIFAFEAFLHGNCHSWCHSWSLACSSMSFSFFPFFSFLIDLNYFHTLLHTINGVPPDIFSSDFQEVEYSGGGIPIRWCAFFVQSAVVLKIEWRKLIGGWGLLMMFIG